MEHIARAVQIINQGGIIIFPTDTAFGIGCRIDNQDAVDRLFVIRRRSRSQAMPILVNAIDMALAYLDDPSEIVRRFMKTYWPGALTIVAPCKKKLGILPHQGRVRKYRSADARS